MQRVTFNFWAGARAAARTSSETVDAESVAAALALLHTRHPDPAFARVIRASSLLRDGTSLTGPALAMPLDEAAVVEVLPPFAGG